jgi:hypothetical protein
MAVRVSPPGITTCLAVLAVFATAAASETVAQEAEEIQEAEATADTSASLAGQVVSALTGKPASDATVFLKRARRGAITDLTGSFRIDGLPGGPDTVAIRLQGTDPQFRAIDLYPSRVTQGVFIVAERIFEVAELRVELKQMNVRERRLSDRRKTGAGVLITREMIEEANPNLPSDMLRNIPRVDVTPYRGAIPEIYIGSGTLACKPPFYLDGVLTRDMELDELAVAEIEDIEVYRGPAEVPLEYKQDSNRCGALVVWTREGGPRR